MSAELWRDLDGFDEDYFLYWEDVDLSARVHALGGRIAVLDRATVIHDEGGTQTEGSSRAKSEGYYYYNIRNRSLYARKHLPPDRERSWRRGARRAAWEIILRGGRRQLLSLPPWRALARGLRDGRRGVTGPRT